MYKNKKSKKGLFLSVELIVILVVIILFCAIVVSGLAYTFKVYRAYKFAQDVSVYSEAFINFTNIYDFYPGDVSTSGLPSELNVGKVSANHTSILTARTGLITPFKALVLFQDLQAAKLITSIDVSDTVTLKNSYKLQSTLPTSSFNDSLVWTIILDKTTSQPYVEGSVIYDSVYGVYKESWMSKPRLVLVSASSAGVNVGVNGNAATLLPNGNLFPYPSVVNVGIVNDINSYYGAISGSFASLVDKKYDDGIPHGINSKYVGENIEVAGGAGCTNMPYTTAATATTAPIGRGGATPTQASYTNALYMPNNASNPAQACLMTIKIAGF